ncbi:cytochrome b-c1 complex subunit 8-like [Leguminivora glycinivorella]|uniref:cytochrome b-c1 complex subunit 8-like n=1 Tax=Leguminivora glycinivorella TaxID=1035111 RepID=UPI00200D2DB2|nr:cytochrome b-c1 complex subunit 8-like [Leguminivora glycinivorella]
MGKHFGELATIRGIVYYRLSPHELNPIAGLLSRGLPNVWPRTTATILRWLPPFILGYASYASVEYAFLQSKRKNPKDYLNEVDPNPPPPPPPEEKKCEPKDKKKK